MIRTQVYIPEQLYAQAKAFASMEGISISQLLRRGMDLAISKNYTGAKKGNGPLDDIIGSISVRKSAEAALNHNDIYDAGIPKVRKKIAAKKRSKR